MLPIFLAFRIVFIIILLVLVESLTEQDIITLPEHLSSQPVCSGVRVTRYTNSDEPFGIFKLFSVLYTIYKVYILLYPIALLKAYILMIGLCIFTNNIQ